jgi:hypothetical protein
MLLHDNDDVVRRVALLKSLGYEEAHRMVLKQPSVLNFKDQTVKETAAWWNQTGLDHVKLVTAHPNLLGVSSVEELQAKLDFLRSVVGVGKEDLNNAGSLFHRSLDGRLRPRFFYALLKHRLARFGSTNTMMKETDATFLAMASTYAQAHKKMALPDNKARRAVHAAPRGRQCRPFRQFQFRSARWR